MTKERISHWSKVREEVRDLLSVNIMTNWEPATMGRAEKDSHKGSIFCSGVLKSNVDAQGKLGLVSIGALRNDKGEAI